MLELAEHRRPLDRAPHLRAEHRRELPRAPIPEVDPLLRVDRRERRVLRGDVSRLRLRLHDRHAVRADLLRRQVRGPKREHRRADSRDRVRRHVVRRRARDRHEVADREAVQDPRPAFRVIVSPVAPTSAKMKPFDPTQEIVPSATVGPSLIRSVVSKVRIVAVSGNPPGHVVRDRAGEGHHVAHREPVRDPRADRASHRVTGRAHLREGESLGCREVRAHHLPRRLRLRRARAAVRNLRAGVDEALVACLVRIHLRRDVAGIRRVREVAHDHDPRTTFCCAASAVRAAVRPVLSMRG